MEGGVRVLYVDDEPGLLEIAQIFLEQTGDFQVTTSTSAKASLESHQILSYDAIISDYKMPGMDGIAFLKAVRQRSADIPFILFTGRGREEVVIEAINNGADFYLQKGGDPQAQFAELAHKIRHAVRRRVAELDRIQSEEKFSKLFIANPSLEAITDLTTGKLVDINEAFTQTTGYTREDVIGKTTREINLFFDYADRELMAQALTHAGILHNFETMIRTKTGDIRTLDFTGQRIRVGNKDVLFTQAVDITERKRLEKDLEREHGELQASYEQLAAAEEERREQYEVLAQSERQIRINEERLIMAQAVGHTGSWEYNVETGELWVSSEGLRVFGFHRNAGNFPLDAIEACIPERERHRQALADLISKGQAYDLELAINPADGSAPRIIHSVARLEKDAGGRPLRVTCVSKDITERKRWEDEIAFKNTVLSTQQETTPDAILIVDENGKILQYNRQFIELWGVQEDPVARRIDEPVLQFVLKQPADPEAFLSRVNYLYDHKEKKNFEELLLGDGRILEHFSAPMLGETGKYYGRVWYFRDITRQKRAEQDLQKSESRWRQWLEQSPVPMALYNLDGTILFNNERFISIVGYTTDDIANLGDWYRRVFPDPHYRQEMQEAWEDRIRKSVSRGEFIEPLEIRIFCKDGSTRILEFSGIVIGDTILVTAYDLTARKAIEDTVRKSEAKYRELADFLPQIIFELDLDLRVTYANREALTVFGLIDEDLEQGINALSFIDPSQHAQAKESVQKSLEGIPFEPHEYTALRKDGSTFPVIIYVALVYRNETRAGFRGVIVDITARKKTEDELRKSEERFRSIVETSPNMIWEVDQQGKFRYMSPVVTAIMGYIPEEIIGKPVTDLVPEEKKELALRELKHMVSKEGSLSPVEVPARHRDGRDLVLEIRPARLTGPDGRLNGLRGVTVDITERKIAEGALRRANRQLTLLAGITRHDILNKISVILGYLKIAEKKSSDPVLVDTLRKIKSATVAIRSQIEFTRIYQDLGTHGAQWIAMDSVMPVSHVPATIMLNADVGGISVFADPLLERVFFNLFDNSVRHGGWVTEIRVWSRKSGGDLVIIWEDNGIGIAGDEKELIFERGFGKNTGLGMFLVREILTLTGITIRETGEAGKGARFEITVPKDHYRSTPQ